MPTTQVSNAELMQTLDDAWNAQDVEVFRARHKPNVVVRWPGQPEPTRGIEDHEAESIAFWKTFPDQHLDIGRTGSSSPPATTRAPSLASQGP
jgi:SnoaL-like polyketide cyclase